MSKWDLSLAPNAPHCANCDRNHGDEAPCINEIKDYADGDHRISWCSVVCFLDDMRQVEKIRFEHADQWEFARSGYEGMPTNCSGCNGPVELGRAVTRRKLEFGLPHRVHCSVGCFLLDLKVHGMISRQPSVWLVESGDDYEGYQSVDCTHASETGAVACAEQQAKGMGYEKPEGRENAPHWKKGGKWISVNVRELDP